MKEFTKCVLCAMLITMISIQAKEIEQELLSIEDTQQTRYLKDFHTIRFKKTAAIVEAIDGLRRVMDGFEIARAIEVARKVHVLQHGIYNEQSKNYIPQYMFNGKAYTLKGLIALEHATEVNFKNHPKYTQIKQQQKALLEKMKKDFEGITGPYLASSAKGTHDQMMAFISEFCELAQRPFSQLLKWKKGEEFKSLREHIQNFEILDSLCTDLKDFLKVLVRNFPKALAQYNKMQKNPIK